MDLLDKCTRQKWNSWDMLESSNLELSESLGIFDELVLIKSIEVIFTGLITHQKHVVGGYCVHFLDSNPWMKSESGRWKILWVIAGYV
jgi:hypothetical protein